MITLYPLIDLYVAVPTFPQSLRSGPNFPMNERPLGSITSPSWPVYRKKKQKTMDKCSKYLSWPLRMFDRLTAMVPLAKVASQ